LEVLFTGKILGKCLVLVRGNVLWVCSGEFFEEGPGNFHKGNVRWGISGLKLSRVDVWISVQDYTSLATAVMFEDPG